MTMVLVFWISCAAIAYVYVGYPLALAAWARLRPRPIAADRRAAAGSPGVSIVVAARNEGERLPARLENLLGLDYPADRRQIIVVSDGSTDDTLARLAAYADSIDTIALPPGGKALALNAAVERARFDLIVFADARQVFAPDAVAELVKPFRDPQVGAVTGELLLDSESGRRTAAGDRRSAEGGDERSGPDVERRSGAVRRRTLQSTIADGVGLYWRYEKQLRRLESTVWTTLGATGAIYAMRRALWKALPADTLLDDVLAPMRCVLAGYRVVFNDRARAFDRTSPDADTEARRKIRTLAGNYQVLRLEPRLLLPWRNRVWLQYVSHKIGRLLVPYALLAFLASSVVLAGRHPVYTAALGAQCLFYVLAAYGAWLDRQGALDARPETPGFAVGWSGVPPRDDRGAVNA